MTRRERMERRQERREEWAEKAQARAASRFGTADGLASQIPLGQPILVGHHSERHARRDAERITNNMHKGCEELKLAEHHAARAAGIEHQLERSVFSDDPDAIPALEARIAEANAKAEQYGAINKAWRKTSGPAPERVAGLVASGVVSQKLAETIARTMELAPWLDKPLDATNVRAGIRRDQKRIEEICSRKDQP